MTKRYPQVSRDALFEDFRGWIENFSLPTANRQLPTRFNLLFTKKGAFRGGDYHPNTQFNYVISGRMKIVTHERTVRLNPGQSNIIPPGCPHSFKALSDCLMVEFWNGPFKATFYPPFRKLVTG